MHSDVIRYGGLHEYREVHESGEVHEYRRVHRICALERQEDLRDRNSPICTMSQNGYGTHFC